MAQLVIPRPHALGGLTSPLELPNLAAWYALDGIASDSTYLISGSNELKLVADRSGNSAVNGLVLNGVVGCNASTPDIAGVFDGLDPGSRANNHGQIWGGGAAVILLWPEHERDDLLWHIVGRNGGHNGHIDRSPGIHRSRNLLG
jgi:hypothetical protein